MCGMSDWIFKIIYIPIIAVIFIANGAIITMVVKDTGLHQPYTWLLIIGGVAVFAEWVVKK